MSTNVRGNRNIANEQQQTINSNRKGLEKLGISDV